MTKSLLFLSVGILILSGCVSTPRQTSSSGVNQYFDRANERLKYLERVVKGTPRESVETFVGTPVEKCAKSPLGSACYYDDGFAALWIQYTPTDQFDGWMLDTITNEARLAKWKADNRAVDDYLSNSTQSQSAQVNLNYQPSDQGAGSQPLPQWKQIDFACMNRCQGAGSQYWYCKSKCEF